MTSTSSWPVLGIILIFLGLVVKFEFRVITSEQDEEQKLEERKAEKQ